MVAVRPMSSSVRRHWILRVLVAASLCAALLATTEVGTGAADLSSQISTAKSAAGALRTQIASDSAQIARTDGGLQAAQDRLEAIQRSLDVRVERLKTVQNSLLKARDHLVDVENHLHAATRALAANLVAGYESAPPSLVSVVLDSHGFSQLLNQLSFAGKIARQNATIVSLTRTARVEVIAEPQRLAVLEKRDRRLATQILAQRNRAAALQSALRREQIRELAERSKVSGRYDAVRGRIAALQHKLDVQERAAAQAAVRAAATGNANVGGIAIDTSGMVQPPAGAPAAVREIIAAGNAIATLPYIYGGGHASFQADGYDCSGSVSYVLAAAGLVTSPMVSGQYMDWGDPGAGRWVDLWATDGHVWMTVAGWRFDTVALAETGTRWAQGGGEFALSSWRVLCLTLNS